MNVTKAQKEQAAKIGKQHGIDAVFVNNKNEFFTNENLASLSVNGSKSKYAKIAFSGVAEKESDNTADILKQITSAETVEAVDSILNDELEGENREAVIEACEKKIEELKK